MNALDPVTIGLGLLAAGVICGLLVWLAVRLVRRIPAQPASSQPIPSTSIASNPEAVLIVQSGGRVVYTNPTANEWLLEQGDTLDRSGEEEHTLSEEVRDVLETMHSIRCAEDLCHPTCDFTWLIAHYYERLSVREMADRFGLANKGSAWYRLERARTRFKEALLIELGEDPYE